MSGAEDFVIEETPTKRGDGRWRTWGWATCSCGKERYVSALDVDPELAAMRLKLAAMSVCDRCSAEMHRAEDSCPESVPLPRNGSSMCRLGWDHEGRCEPIVTDEDLAEVMRRLGHG